MGRGRSSGAGVQMLRRPSGRAEHPFLVSPCGPPVCDPGAHGHRLRLFRTVRGATSRHGFKMLAAPGMAHNQAVRQRRARELPDPTAAARPYRLAERTTGEAALRARTNGRSVGLDCLRAAAVTLVILHHWGFGWPDSAVARLFARTSWFGVDLFFVLSGFLVTGLILREHAMHGSFGGRELPRPPRLQDLSGAVRVHRRVRCPRRMARPQRGAQPRQRVCWPRSPSRRTTPTDSGGTPGRWRSRSTSTCSSRSSPRWPSGAVTSTARCAARWAPSSPSACSSWRSGSSRVRSSGWAGTRSTRRPTCASTGCSSASPSAASGTATATGSSSWCVGTASCWSLGAACLLAPVVLGRPNPLLHTVGFTSVALGFGVILLLVLSHEREGAPRLAARPVAFLGRYSYTTYLWQPFVFIVTDRLLAGIGDRGRAVGAPRHRHDRRVRDRHRPGPRRRDPGPGAARAAVPVSRRGDDVTASSAGTPSATERANSISPRSVGWVPSPSMPGWRAVLAQSTTAAVPRSASS